MDIPILIHLVVGLTLLSAGYRLFWLFVGCVGFAAGYSYATALLSIESDMLILLLAMVIGFVGALLALFLQRLSIVIAGFLGGAFIAVSILQILEVGTEQLILLTAVLAGVFGAVVLFLLFDWALIFLSSFVGALLVVQSFKLKPSVEIGLFVALFVVGAVIQTRLKRGAKKTAATS